MLPNLVAAHAIEAGLPLSEASLFVGIFLTAPSRAAEIPGVTASVLEAALLGSPVGIRAKSALRVVSGMND